MTKFAKILSLVLALTMLCGAAFAEAPQLAAEAQAEVDVEAYEEESSKVYDLVLSEYNEYYAKAKEAATVSERYALMAIAEDVTKVHAICVRCGGQAQFSHRTIAGDKLVVLGETESYEPLCRACYLKAREEREMKTL